VRGFEIFLYKRENLGGVLGFFFKNPSKLKKFPKKGRGFDPQNPSLNAPLHCPLNVSFKIYEKNVSTKYRD